MSNSINSIWYERAAQMCAYFEGKLPAEMIQIDLDNDDFDELQHHVLQAEAEASQQEFALEPNEFLAGDIY